MVDFTILYQETLIYFFHFIIQFPTINLVYRFLSNCMKKVGKNLESHFILLKEFFRLNNFWIHPYVVWRSPSITHLLIYHICHYRFVYHILHYLFIFQPFIIVSSFWHEHNWQLNSMSPAAQRLASHSLRIKNHTDKALRASYSPIPLHVRKSPSFLRPDSKSPGSCSFRSGGSSARSNTPGSEIGIRTPDRGTNERTLSKNSDPSIGDDTSNEMTDFPSLTDNLLNLPRRKKAIDFF